VGGPRETVCRRGEQDGESYQSIQPSKDTCPIWQDQSGQQNEALTSHALGSQGMVHPDEKIESDGLGFLHVDEPHGEGGSKTANQWNPKHG
jgi:hypothetical protein